MVKFDTSGYVLNRFVDFKYDNERRNIRVCCPFCGELKHKLYIRVEGFSIAHCFHCGYKSTFVEFVKDFEGYNTYKEVYVALSSFFDNSEDKEVPLYREESILNRMLNRYRCVSDVELPYDFEPIHTDARDSYYAQAYLLKRGFPIQYSNDFGIGYCTRGRYKNRIIVPVYKSQELAYFVARTYLEDEQRRVLSSNKVKYPEAMFNYDRAMEYNTIYITEGWADALSVGYNAIALNGKEISLPKINMLTKDSSKSLVVMLDDEAQLDTMEVAYELSKRHNNVYCAFIELGFGDPNEVFLYNNFDKIHIERFNSDVVMPRLSIKPIKKSKRYLFDLEV